MVQFFTDIKISKSEIEEKFEREKIEFQKIWYIEEMYEESFCCSISFLNFTLDGQICIILRFILKFNFQFASKKIPMTAASKILWFVSLVASGNLESD